MTPLCGSLCAKIEEQIERVQHVARLTPAGSLTWSPAWPNAWTIGELLGHLLDCAAGICAALQAAEPQRLAHFSKLRSAPVNRPVGVNEFEAQLEIFRKHIEEAFTLLDDAALSKSIPTVFVPKGETLLTLLLGNLEHFINHKRELFFYLKMLGIPVGTSDLYKFRG